MKIFSHLQHGFSYKPVLYLDHLPHLFKMTLSHIVKAENKGSHKEWVYTSREFKHNFCSIFLQFIHEKTVNRG